MTAPETLALIEEVRRLDKAATPGPWDLALAAIRSPETMAATARVVESGGAELDREPLTSDLALMARYRTLVPKLADALEAALREERQNAEMLRVRLAEAERMRDAYKKAKQENDDRFMCERDAAEARAVAAERLAEVRGIALGKLREMADECEAALVPPGGQQVRPRRMTVPPSIIKELRQIADEGSATRTYDEVRKLEARAVAAEERVRVLGAALEPLAGMSPGGACCASRDEVLAARRALGRAE